MMIRRTAPLLLALTLPLALACDRGDGEGAAAGDERDGAAAPWLRTLVFLPEDDGTEGGQGPLLFDFRTVEGRPVSEHVARGWMLDEGGWSRMLDQQLESAPNRDPWRILPAGPLRVVAGMDDDLQALVLRDAEPPLRVEPGPFLGEWVPPGGAEVRVREAELLRGDRSRSGWLVDARFPPADGSERSMPPAPTSEEQSASAPAGQVATAQAAPGQGPARQAATDTAAARDSADVAGQTAAPNAGPATPIGPPLPHPDRLTGALAGPEGRLFLIAQGADGSIVWMWTDQGERSFAPTTLVSAPDGSIRIGARPVGADATGTLSARLEVIGRNAVGRGALLGVQGTIEVNGASVPVRGLVREPE